MLIFAYLRPEELARCSLVCRNFARAIFGSDWCARCWEIESCRLRPRVVFVMPSDVGVEAANHLLCFPAALHFGA